MFLEQRNRRVVPRWRDFESTKSLGELENAKSPVPVSVSDATVVERRALEWSHHRTIWHAADLLSSSFVVGNSEKYRDAASFVLENRNSAPTTLVSLASRVLGHEDSVIESDADIRKDLRISEAIHATRNRLRDEPRNAMQWAELSRLHILRGQRGQALRCMTTAAALAPDSRFIVRSAARLFLHEHDAAKSLRLIRSANGAKSDPWLLSAEISIASACGSPSALAKVGQHRNSDDNISFFARAELSSALGTLELENGKNRHARQLFKQSLKEPNENSIAQVEWANRQIGGLEVSVPAILSVPRSFEVAAQLSLLKGDWTDAIDHGRMWLIDQPFSKRPAMFTSYVSSLIEEYGWSIELLERSLKVNPNDEMLLNNLAFALASSNQIQKAIDVLARADYQSMTKSSAIALAATHGLVFFRAGFPDKGRELYHVACERARQHSVPQYLVMAQLYLAREEVLANTPQALETVKQALDAAAGSSEKDVLLLVGQVKSLVIKAAPSSAPHFSSRSSVR